jgi:hypothetical protein
MDLGRKIKLYPTREQDALLQIKTEIQTNCVKWWLDKIKELDTTTMSLLNKHYKECRDLFNLGSDMIQISMFIAIRMAKTAEEVRSSFLSVKFVRFNEDCIVAYFGDGAPIQIKSSKHTPILRTSVEKNFKFINGEWYLLFNEKVDSVNLKKYKRCVGVDLGIAKTAVCADWMARTQFFLTVSRTETKRIITGV